VSLLRYGRLAQDNVRERDRGETTVNLSRNAPPGRCPNTPISDSRYALPSGQQQISFFFDSFQFFFVLLHIRPQTPNKFSQNNISETLSFPIPSLPYFIRLRIELSIPILVDITYRLDYRLSVVHSMLSAPRSSKRQIRNSVKFHRVIQPT
jgi:hypothetical protein